MLGFGFEEEFGGYWEIWLEGGLGIVVSEVGDVGMGWCIKMVMLTSRALILGG